MAIKNHTRIVTPKADPNPPWAVRSGIPSIPAPTVVPKTIKEALKNRGQENREAREQASINTLNKMYSF